MVTSGRISRSVCPTDSYHSSIRWEVEGYAWIMTDKVFLSLQLSEAREVLTYCRSNRRPLSSSVYIDYISTSKPTMFIHNSVEFSVHLLIPHVLITMLLISENCLC